MSHEKSLLEAYIDTLPPIIMEMENGVLEDVFSLQMGYFPLPWLRKEG